MLSFFRPFVFGRTESRAGPAGLSVRCSRATAHPSTSFISPRNRRATTGWSVQIGTSTASTSCERTALTGRAPSFGSTYVSRACSRFDVARNRTASYLEAVLVGARHKESSRSSAIANQNHIADECRSAVERSMRPCRPGRNVRSVPGTGQTIRARPCTSYPDCEPAQTESAFGAARAPDSKSCRSCDARIVNTYRRLALPFAERYSRRRSFA